MPTYKHLLAEVFGFLTTNHGQKANRFRTHRLCPFNNKVPNCTKDKAKNPLGVCSVYHEGKPVITCPIRFREDWIIADDAASFFFGETARWSSLTEVRLNDQNGKSAGNIDVVLVAYDDNGKIYDFGALEIQAVYISGNVREPFEDYMKDPKSRASMDWSKEPNYSRPDYLSSSRKRLAPQLLFKGGILHTWEKRIAVALNKSFFDTLPGLKRVPRDSADIAWLIYELEQIEEKGHKSGRYSLKKVEETFTEFEPALLSITTQSPRMEIPKPVNVASVPQRSPFRYPGGKTWFVPTFRQWIRRIYPRPRILVEPFAGGGIISLTALFENLVERAVMVELDDEIAAVWESIVNGDAEWLAKRILDFDLTKGTITGELRKPPRTLREKAFQTILKNRTLHGGILAEGSRFLKYGENGKGIRSRWYPETLAKRLRNLNHIASRIDFRCDDGLKTMQEFAEKQNAVYFIDPPYTAGGKKAGKRLYKHSDLNHEQLFAVCRLLKGDFLMTYDNAEEVRRMARAHGFHMRLIPMTNTHHATMEELVIGKDLSWMDGLPTVHEPEAEYGARVVSSTRTPVGYNMQLCYRKSNRDPYNCGWILPHRLC